MINDHADDCLIIKAFNLRLILSVLNILFTVPHCEKNSSGDKDCRNSASLLVTWPTKRRRVRSYNNLCLIWFVQLSFHIKGLASWITLRGPHNYLFWIMAFFLKNVVPHLNFQFVQSGQRQRNIEIWHVETGPTMAFYFLGRTHYLLPLFSPILKLTLSSFNLLTAVL